MKYLKHALVAALLSSAVQAQANEPISYDISIVYKRSVVLHTKVKAIDGVESPFNAVHTVNYKSADPAADVNVSKAVDEQLLTGLKAALIPTRMEDGKVKTKINLAYSEIIDLKQQQHKNGFMYHVPSMVNAKFDTEVNAQVGETVSLSDGDITLQLLLNDASKTK